MQLLKPVTEWAYALGTMRGEPWIVLQQDGCEMVRAKVFVREGGGLRSLGTVRGSASFVAVAARLLLLRSLEPDAAFDLLVDLVTGDPSCPL